MSKTRRTVKSSAKPGTVGRSQIRAAARQIATETRDGRRPELPPSVEPPIEPLSERELEVLRLLASGRTSREISHELYVSYGTTMAHTANISRKLDAHNRAEMINSAKALGLLD